MPHRSTVLTFVVISAFAVILFAACILVTRDTTTVVFLLVPALFFGMMTVDALIQLRPDRLDLTEAGVHVVEVDRAPLVRKHPLRWFFARRVNLRWDHILGFDRCRWALNGPAVVLHLSEDGARLAGSTTLTLPAIDSLSIEHLETELKRRWRVGLLQVGVKVPTMQ